MWHMTCDMWHVTCDMWHVTCDMWHVTCDTWHVTCLERWTFPQNFSSLALTVCDLWYYEDLEEKAHWVNQLMNESINDEAVYRTAPATPGLLIIWYQVKYFFKESPPPFFANNEYCPTFLYLTYCWLLTLDSSIFIHIVIVIFPGPDLPDKVCLGLINKKKTISHNTWWHIKCTTPY